MRKGLLRMQRKYTWSLHTPRKQCTQVEKLNKPQAAHAHGRSLDSRLMPTTYFANRCCRSGAALQSTKPAALWKRITCRMRVPIVMAPCGVLVDLVSDRHLITMDVEDMDTCSQRMSYWSDGVVQEMCTGCQ